MLEKLRRAGVVGGGGAGFPTWKKLDAKASILLLNAVECEPVLAGDKFLMRNNAPDILEGLFAAAAQIEAEDIVVAVKGTYKAEIEAMKQAIKASGRKARLHALRAVYPAGDEHVAVFEATGRTVPPGGIPISVGVVVISVSTAVNIAAAMKGIPVTRRLVTVAGEVKTPMLLEAPVGISVGDCIEAAGGASVSGFRVFMGGPMMGRLLCEGAESDTVITKTDSGVLVLPSGHPLVRAQSLTVQQMLKRARSACIQCRYCTEQCPRHLLGHRINPHKIMRSTALGEEPKEADGALLCSECGVCELYACPMSLSPRRINRELKAKLMKRGVKADTCINEANGMRFARQIPSGRLSARIGVGGMRADSSRSVPLEAETVAIPLKQHIGEVCVPCVEIGDRVSAGEAVGRVPDGKLGADVHSSIHGVVVCVEDCRVTIKAGG